MKNLTGSRFGRLVVLNMDCKVGRRRYCTCVCDCGNDTKVLPHNLISGCTKSCSCKGHRVSDAGFRRMLQSYKGSAKVRRIPWELTDEQFRELTSSPCYYTGRPPSSVFVAGNVDRRKRRGLSPSLNLGDEYINNGVDRLDNSKGYTIDNCVPCCATANYAKLKTPHDEFIAFCKEVAQRF